MRVRLSADAGVYALATAAWVAGALLVSAAGVTAEAGYGLLESRLCCTRVETPWGSVAYDHPGAGSVAMLLLASGFLALMLRAVLRALDAPWWARASALAVEAVSLSVLSGFVAAYLKAMAALASSPVRVAAGVGVIEFQPGSVEAWPPVWAALIPPTLALAAVAMEPHEPPGGVGGRRWLVALSLAAVAVLAALAVAAALHRVPLQPPEPPRPGEAVVFDGWSLRIPLGLLGVEPGSVECELDPPVAPCNVTVVDGWLVASPPWWLRVNSTLAGERLTLTLSVEAPVGGESGGIYKARVSVRVEPREPSWTVRLEGGLLSLRLGSGTPPEAIEYVKIQWLRYKGDKLIIVETERVDGPLSALIAQAPEDADLARVYVSYTYKGETRLWGAYVHEGETVTGPSTW